MKQNGGIWHPFLNLQVQVQPLQGTDHVIILITTITNIHALHVNIQH